MQAADAEASQSSMTLPVVALFIVIQGVLGCGEVGWRDG